MTNSNKLTRHTAREKVLQALFAVDISGENPDLMFAYIFEDVNTECDEFIFAKDLFQKTIRNKEEFIHLINSKLKNWKFDRLTTIDKTILLMSICEFLDFSDIPKKVTLNEAITLAKHFSTEQSGKFVNGILDAILHELEKENKINKSGRGLLNTKK